MPKPPKLTESQLTELREILALVTQAWERYRVATVKGLAGAPGRDPGAALYNAMRLCEDRLEDATGERVARASGKSIGFGGPAT